MAKLEKVIIKTMKESAVSSGIKKGTTGHIVHEHGTPDNNICVRFLATKLGFIYDPKTDDPDYKYIRMFVPNGNYEVVPPKNIVSQPKDHKTTKIEPGKAPKKTKKMQSPWIMAKTKDGWEALYGHACTNQAQMEEYIQVLDPNGHVFKIMDLSKVKIDQSDKVIEEVIVEKIHKKKM
jgi:hypothetical protein